MALVPDSSVFSAMVNTDLHSIVVHPMSPLSETFDQVCCSVAAWLDEFWKQHSCAPRLGRIRLDISRSSSPFNESSVDVCRLRLESHSRGFQKDLPSICLLDLDFGFPVSPPLLHQPNLGLA